MTDNEARLVILLGFAVFFVVASFITMKKDSEAHSADTDRIYRECFAKEQELKQTIETLKKESYDKLTRIMDLEDENEKLKKKIKRLEKKCKELEKEE